MSYPIIINKVEFETATKIIDLDAYLEELTGDIPNATADKFLDDVIYYTYEGAIYSAGHRVRANNIINAYSGVLEPQIKALLVKVGEYMLEQMKGERAGLYSGMLELENGDMAIKDTQEIITKILPPNVMTYVMNISPNIVYAGGGY